MIAIPSGDDRAAEARAVAAAIDSKGPVVEDAIAQARAAVAAGAVSVETLQRFRRVREQIDEGWRAYSRVQFDFAQSRLASARTEAEALVALPGGAALYADAALKLGAVLGHIGRAQEAETVIALALALDPDRPITLAEFSPDVVSAVDAARSVGPRSPAFAASLHVGPRSPAFAASLHLGPEVKHVRVTTEPPGASVSIDNVDLGRSPLDVEVTRGQHVAISRTPQFTTRSLAFAVDGPVAGTSVDVALALDRDPELTRLEAGAVPGMTDIDTQLLVEATLRFADLDELVLVLDTERRGEPTLLVQRCVAAPTRCSAIVELGYGNRGALVEAARTAVRDTRATDLRYTPSLFGDPRVTGKRLADRCGLCRSPLLWGGVGVAAVITTVAVIAIVSASKPPPIVSTEIGDFMKP